MARARRTKAPVVTNGGNGAPQGRVLPPVCPVCGELLPGEPLDAMAHLHSHAPGQLCSRCHEAEKGWRVDWDLVKHPRPDVSLFFCSGCGRYAPLM
jgi:hypothetical protein